MAKTARISHKLRQAVCEVRGRGIKQHQLARAAGVNVSVFSQIVCDHLPPSPDDDRVLRIAEVVGLDPADAFEDR